MIVLSFREALYNFWYINVFYVTTVFKYLFSGISHLQHRFIKTANKKRWKRWNSHNMCRILIIRQPASSSWFPNLIFKLSLYVSLSQLFIMIFLKINYTAPDDYVYFYCLQCSPLSLDKVPKVPMLELHVNYRIKLL